MIFVVLMAIGQFLCASGSGHPETPAPLPDWLNDTANVINIVIGVMVFIPRIRVLAASLSVVVTVVSMITNYLVDGPAYFFKCYRLVWYCLGSRFTYFGITAGYGRHPKNTELFD